MTDRRRINGPPAGTVPPVYAVQLDNPSALQRPLRIREPNQLRKIFIRTGLTPSASGSAYLELQSPTTQSRSLLQPTSSLKIACAVHGPKPLPRSAPFSPQLVLTTSVKFTPYASRSLRRGYVRDATERDLGVHLETALRGVIIGDRWPKSGVEVVITVLEAEEDAWWVDEAHFGIGQSGGIAGAGSMTVLAGCITAASAAMISAGIDCVDLVVGGVAAIVRQNAEAENNQASQGAQNDQAASSNIVLDPCPSEHDVVEAACVVAYLSSRDELTETWMKGNTGSRSELLIDRAVEAAVSARTVLTAVLAESAQPYLKADGEADDTAQEHQDPRSIKTAAKITPEDVAMT